jgi:uncharacterized membrane protein
MSAFVADWLNLLIRWAHLIAGIGWIGTSFYFIALDLSLKKRERMGEGVHGTAWEVHGGGFYHVQKYTVAPKELPDDLIWYKWEAYLTWVTGFLLLVTQYLLARDRLPHRSRRPQTCSGRGGRHFDGEPDRRLVRL